MSADVGRRKATILLIAAVAVLVAGVFAVLAVPQRASRKDLVALPPTTTAPPAPHPSTTVVVSGTPAPTTARPQAGAGAGPPPVTVVEAEPTSPPPPSPPPTTEEPPAQGTVRAPSAVVVACHPDLALEDSPDAPYSFLCTRGATPISWPSDSIRLFAAGLSPSQMGGLEIALTQWQADARFTVTRVDSAGAANVVMTSAPLDSNEDGYTSMHYVCAATCAYDHADVTLASTAELTKTSWTSTILHELGHVAGLNHVARHSEVMYPEIDAQSPPVFGSGDLAGLQELQKVRTAT